MSHVLQRTLDPRVSPSRVVRCHADDQAPDLVSNARSPGTVPGVRPLVGEQLPVPSENRVRRHERRDLLQHAASQALPQHPETSALIVVESELPGAQLRLQHAILFAKERDHITLLDLEPRQQRCQQHL
jgi:hypothetical protein